jgi:hypothetical protein
MTTLEQIQQDIQALPQDALDLVAQFIQLLKKSSPAPDLQDHAHQQELEHSEKSVYEQFRASGLIGCMSAEENLSTTYKQVLAEGWAQKYGNQDSPKD